MRPVPFISRLACALAVLPIVPVASLHTAVHAQQLQQPARAAQFQSQAQAQAQAPSQTQTPSPASAPAQVIDRIVAAVGQQVITLSDARAAIGLHLLPDVIAIEPVTARPAAAASGAPAIADIVERLVERELMRAEIDRFGVVAPPPEVLEARVDAVRKRFANPAAFVAALDACGLSEARFRAWMTDDWRIEQYIQQRFEAAAQPTDEDVLQYYQSREREFIQNDRPRPFTEVRDEARARLIASRRKALVDDWIAGLRRRADVVILPGKEGA